MKIFKILFCSLYLCLSGNFNLHAQSDFNLNLEVLNDNGERPRDWYGGFSKPITEHHALLDKTIRKEGKYAIKIVAPNTKEAAEGFGASFTIIPSKYAGKNITLRGYVKTEKVIAGYAGLWMRQDGEAGMLEFDNMNNRGLKGDQDWTLCEITLPLNPQTKKINIGGLLVGDGTMWFDDLSLDIDGKPLDQAGAKIEKVYGADADKEFDTGSNVTIENVKTAQIQELAWLGKIWGFLKYHHPSIAAGNHNWDYELFRVLPAVLQAKDKKARSKIYLDWIEKLGPIPSGTTCTSPDKDKLAYQTNFDWLRDNQAFSPTLIEKLNHIYNNRNQEEHYYIGMAPGVGNPIFKQENAYANFETPDAGYRLLALFRYWNAIEYFFPYKDIITEDWEKVLTNFIPTFVKANDALTYRLAALELIAKISDTHANLWGRDSVLTKHNGEKYTAVQVKFIEGQAVVTNYYQQTYGAASGLKIGDIVMKVNGVGVQEIIEAKLDRTPASNYPTQLRDIAKHLLRSNEASLTLEVKRGAETFTKKLNTYPPKELNLYQDYVGEEMDKSYRLLQADIGYVFLGRIKGNEIPDMMELFKNTKGIIIDIRNYPSDFVVFSMTKYLLPSPKDFVKFTGGEIANPGAFTWTEPISVGEQNPDYYKGKVAILINEISQSQAEYTTMALRTAPQAKVIGSTTAGADGNVSRLLLPGNLRTMISGIGVFYPDGTPTQRVGIIPDIPCEPTIEGIRAGKDEVLERAIQYIKENKKP